MQVAETRYTRLMIDWRSIDTVLLDMDGTLLDLHFDNHFWLDFLPIHYAECNGISCEQARDHLYSQFKRHQGSLNWYCLDFWSQQLQLDIVALKQHVTHKIAYRPHAQQFLNQLKQAGKRRILVTNAHRDSLNLKLEYTGLNNLLDNIISSHDYRFPKEDTAFWEQLTVEHSLQLEHTLLIDDSRPVLQAAKKFGIGQLLRVYQPDSTQPGNNDDEFPSLYCFSDINPPLNADE